MWIVERVSAQAKELDFTHSGRGKHRTTAIIADGVELVNARDRIDLEDFEKDRLQLIVCEECGFVQCASGNWATVRRVGDGLALIPAFGSMARGSWERSEFAPPAFMALRGSPMFRGAAKEELVSLMPWLRDLNLPSISAREMASLVQWEAPGRVLGAFPDPPRFSRDAFVAVDEGDLTWCLGNLEMLLRVAVDHDRVLNLRPAQVRMFFLDLPGTPEWRPLAIADGVFGFAVGGDGGLFIEEVSA
jgi:hypothetical protein